MIIDNNIINEAADHHVGHSEEIDEDAIITAQRESFKWGAKWVLKYIEDNTYNNFDNYNYD